MPIAQSRVIAILTAATDFEQAYTRIAKDLYALTQQSQPPTQAQIENIYWVAAESIQNLAHNKAILHLEREHFRKNARRNEYTARKALEARRKSGIGPREPKGPSFGLIADKYKQLLQDPLEVLPKASPGNMDMYLEMTKKELAAQEAAGLTSQQPDRQQAGQQPTKPQSSEKPFQLIFPEKLSKAQIIALEKLTQQGEEGEGVLDFSQPDPDDP